MDGQISKKQLKVLLGDDLDTMLEEVVEAMNRARPGSIIDDSEELVRVAARKFRRRLAQIGLSYQTFRAVFQRQGQKVRQAQRSEAYGPTFTAEDCCQQPNDPTCLVTGDDGFHVPLITDDEQRKRRENAKRRRRKLRRQGRKLSALPPRPRGADQKWKEAKLVTFYDPGNDYRYTAATTGNHQALGRLMRRHAAQLQLGKADRKYSVTDGVKWIRHQYRQQPPMLDAMILDYYHFRDQTIACAKVLYGEGTDEPRNSVRPCVRPYETRGRWRQ